ncbi:hypothetical protein M3G00_07915 [Brevibacterium casei]|uniref:hypothetical protein n=1 Tax=Brevibacterium casei TaxID=33889 RepID=UPI00223C3B23|nr:hypothetical protein [Brevibacterium casei]MCT2182861.1 hypothetical protein [Brevibacterium casei]
MSSEPYVPNLNEVRADFVALHTRNFDPYQAGRSLTSEQEYYGDQFDRFIAKVKAEAWATGLDTGVGYKLGLDLMGPDAPKPINPFEQEARDE